MEAVRAIRTVTGLSLWNSKLLLDSTPVAVTGPDWLEVANEAARLLEDAGAHATVLCDWCDRPITRGPAFSTQPRVRGHGLPKPAGRVGHRPRTEYASRSNRPSSWAGTGRGVLPSLEWAARRHRVPVSAGGQGPGAR